MPDYYTSPQCNIFWSRFFPFLRWWPRVNRETLKSDLIAGLTGAVIVLPQGVAFALIAGLPPVYGLYSAMVPPIIAALFGSSRHLISGPTTAISIVVFATVSKFAEPGSAQFIGMALTLTFLAGAYQYGLSGHPVVHSFLVSPLFDPVTEPYYADYSPENQVQATTGAQMQAAGFLAAP